MRETLLNIFVIAMLLVVGFTVRTPGFRRAAFRYGNYLIEKVTLGFYSADEARPVVHALVGTLGILGFIGLVIEVLYALAPK